MKRILCLCLVMVSMACHAVRQEDNVSQMIISLNIEMNRKWKEFCHNAKAMEETLQQMDEDINFYNENSRQCAVTICTTDANSFQNEAYTCQNALNQYDGFRAGTAEYISMLSEYKQLVHHQDSLVKVLGSFDVKMLSPKAQKLFPQTLGLIGKLQKQDKKILQRLQNLKPIYDDTQRRFAEATKSSQQKYDTIRYGVLYNFKNNILNILSDWDSYMESMDKGSEARWAMDEAFHSRLQKMSLREAMKESIDSDEYSSWGMLRIAIIFFFSFNYLKNAFLAALFVVLLGWIVKRVCRLKFFEGTSMYGFTDKMQRWLSRFGWAKSLTFFTLWFNVLLWSIVVIATYMEVGIGGNSDAIFYQMFFFFLLLTFIMTFFILRYKGRRFWYSLAVCTPTLVAFVYSLISIIMVMPDEEIAVDTIFIFVLLFAVQVLIFCLWHKQLGVLMTRVSNLCMAFLGLSMVMALVGLQFLSTMIVVFWACFMVCLMVLTSLIHYFDRWIGKYHVDCGSIKRTWWIPVIDRVLYPMAWIYAALLSCRMACSIYSLNDFLGYLLNTYFKTPLGNISLNINLVIFICWSILLATYFSKILYHFADYYHKSKGNVHWEETNFFNKSTIRFLVWSAAIINIMIHMGFNLQWVGYCMAGISTGLGFASREILENFIYGLTLRNGQLKIGDWIVCEGIRGQVKSIGMLSTRVDSVEGTVITITNGRLINMNYENITLNHDYELLHTDFCVNFGEDIERIRQLLIDGYSKFEEYDKSRPVTVFIKNINNNEVDLDFRVWIPASDRIRLAAVNKEYVYDILNANGIKYPYPYINVGHLE